MRAIGKTHIGMLRGINQDSFACFEIGPLTILAVADGMGGHNAGEVASRMASEDVEAFFRNLTPEETGLAIKDLSLTIEAIRTVNRRIHDESTSSPEFSGMGTTLTLVVSDSETANIFHVGDSRAYLINENISQITKDHSLVQYLLDQGQLTEAEAENHPRKNVITRALGTDDDIDVDCFTIALSGEDRLLVCSDGLTNMVRLEAIHSLSLNPDLEQAVDELIAAANKNGGVDNVTVILAEKGGSEQ